MLRLAFGSAGLLLCLMASAQTAAPVAVGIQKLEQVALPDWGTAPANVLPRNDSRIAAEVTARVARIRAEVGEAVKAGQLLVELDATDYRLALAQADAQVSAAQARVALAEQRLRQGLTLKAKQFVSDDAILELNTGVQAAQADLAVAQAQRAVAARNVEKCRITAPFSGVVLERQAQLGAMAVAGAALLRLVDVQPPEIEAQVQAIQADALPQATEISFESHERRYPARLLRLSPVVDSAARTRIARLAFVGQAATVGSSGTLRWRTSTLRLPAELLVKRGPILGAFVVENGRARLAPAPTAQEGRPFTVALPADAAIVVRGQQGLNDGQAVSATVANGAH